MKLFLIQVQLFPNSASQKKHLKDKNIKQIICTSFEHVLSKFGLFYRGKCIKQGKLGYFEYVCSEKISEKDRQEIKIVKKSVESWDGRLTIYSAIMQRVPTDQQNIVLLNGIKAEIKIPELKITETKRIQFITDLITPFQRIQSSFVYHQEHSDGICYHYFDEIKHSWPDQLTYITLNYYLPMKYWKYQLFNLLHLLEHCLLQRSRKSLYYNGQTFFSGGFMQLEVVLNSEDFKDWLSDYNSLIKSKHLNYNLEIQRLGEEMEQMIDINLGLEFPEIAFNSDIYDHQLSSNLLYSLFTLLELKDVIIQNVGPVKTNQFIPKFYQPPKFEQPLLDYFHQDKFLVKQLTTFSNNDFFKIKLDSKEELFYISFMISAGGALIFFDYPYLYIKRGFIEDNFIMSTGQNSSGSYYLAEELFDNDFRFFTFNNYPFYLNGLTNQIIQDIQYTGEIFIPKKFVQKYNKICETIKEQKVSFL